MRPSTRKWIFAALAVVMLLVASMQVGPLNRAREQHHLVAAPIPESARPSMMMTPLMAVGRAWFVDILWIRATKLKEEGRYFDALQLSQFICNLQPRFAAVWAFQAWNMAYNISVTLSTPEERWRWVRNGFELLRDQGIPLNPNNTQLYRELAWIYFHKVGDFTDDMHNYYKLQLALQMEDVLGPPPPDYVRPGRVAGDYYRDYDFKALAASPHNYTDLIDPAQVSRLKARLRKDLGAVVSQARRARSIDEIHERLREFGIELAGHSARAANVEELAEALRYALRDLDIKLDDRESLGRIGSDLADVGKPGKVDPKSPMSLADLIRRLSGLYSDIEIHVGDERLVEGLRGKLDSDRLDATVKLIDPRPIATLAAELAKFGFDVSKPGAYLGLLKALRADKLQLAGVEANMEANRLRDLKQVMNDPATADARKSLELFWRAWRLRNEFKLDPQRIADLQEGFGVTLDFRVAESHALYWANLGMEMGSDKRIAVDVHRLNTNRIEFFCLQKMFRNGRLAMSAAADRGEPPFLGNDIRFGDVLFDAYLRDTDAYKKERNQKPTVSEDFFSGFVGFTRILILRYGELGMREKAKEKYDFLVENYPDPMYEGGLDAFLARQFMEDRSNMDYKSAVARMLALIDRGLVQYIYDEDEEAARYINRARDIYDMYKKEIVSDRMGVQRKFPELVVERLHLMGGSWYPETYVRVCRKLGVEPLPTQEPATQPVE